jgi:60 kDa SS-A/Ro ribonucleoprotein
LIFARSLLEYCLSKEAMMVNKNLFSTRGAAPAETFNAAGGKAYTSSPKHALAQITATNTFNGTYYVDAEDNLKIAKEAALAIKGDPLFLAKTAVYGRQKAYMKDMPAFLMVMLADACRQLPVGDSDKSLFRRTFPKVIDNGKMLRNFIQIARSGATGKKFNVGSGAIRHAIRDWFQNKSPYALFRASVGNDPSMRDILRMARPKPENKQKAALYAYLKGGAFDKETGEFRIWKKGKDGESYLAHQHVYDDLPDIVKQYERYKNTKEGLPPDVDFRLLDSLGLDGDGWKQIARNAGWMMTRMNLNTFQRHGVFDDQELVQIVADRLRDRGEISKARAFPYQLMMAYKMTGSVPFQVQEALQDAMESAIDNVPKINGKIAICVDVSGSMSSPVTGSRIGGVSTNVRCVDCAALFASAIFRKNPDALILPFDTSVYQLRLNPRDSVLTNANTLAKFGGGGTNCSLALHAMNQKREKLDAVIFISDYESWVDSGYGYGYGRGTGMMQEWEAYKRHNPNAVLICIDLTPRCNSQVKERPGILQVGGFADSIFDVVSNFIEQRNAGADFWVREIEKIEI